MNWLGMIREYFEEKRELLLRALVDARKAAADAPKPNESRSDTTINEKQKLINALEQDLANNKRFLASIPQTRDVMDTVQVWSYVVTDKMKMILVPDGMGGGQIEETRLVSLGTPIGLELLGKRKLATFTVNGVTSQIMELL